MTATIGTNVNVSPGWNGGSSDGRGTAVPGEHAAAKDQSFFLSTAPAERSQRWLAGAVVLLALVGFALAAPFARTPLAQVPAFIAIYQTALVVLDGVTATMLFGQFVILRSRTLLVIASGYLFCLP